MEIIIRNWLSYMITEIQDNQLDMFKENNEEIIENPIITQDQRDLINNWCCFTYNDWIIITQSEIDLTNIENTKKEIKVKLDRMQEIRAELVKQWFTADLPTDSRIDWKLLIYKQSLLDEYSDLQEYVDENFDSDLIDDVIDSFF